MNNSVLKLHHQKQIGIHSLVSPVCRSCIAFKTLYPLSAADDENEEGGVLGGEDVESGSDAELAAVLEHAGGLVGRRQRGTGKGAQDSDGCD